MNIENNLYALKNSIPDNVNIVAVSKTKPINDLINAYKAGQRIFGENKVQEMVTKFEKLPKDIEWHMIGHLQTNKVKYMASFVNTIHSVDSYKLLKKFKNRHLKTIEELNASYKLELLMKKPNLA